ncbi:oligosaccharide flippase family protein [Colwellia sp. RE-S-Sl-9]
MSIKKEAIWIFGSTGISALSQIIVLILLSQSEDVGVLGELAIINIVLFFAFSLQDLGLSSYFIHRQSISKKEESTLFSINLALGCLATIIVFFLSIPIGVFYVSDNITKGLQIVAFNFIIIGATSQYQAHFIKMLQSDLLAKIEIISKVILLCFVLYFVYYLNMSLFGYLYAVLIGSAVKLLLILFISPVEWHPSFSFDKNIIKPALRFGFFQMGSQIINQLRTQLDQLIIGKWLGIEALGVYSLAKEFIMQPTKLIAPITSKLALPRLAKVQTSVKGTKLIFNQASQAILLLNMIVYLILTIALYYLIPQFFGQDYIYSFEIYTTLLLVGLLRPIGSLFGVLAQSQGVSNIEFRWNLISAMLSVVVLCLAFPFKTLEAFALAMIGSQLLLSFYAPIYFSKYIGGIDHKKHLIRIVFIVFLYCIIKYSLPNEY